MPVDYDNPSGDKTLLKDKTVSLQRLQERMEDKNSLVNLCIIDACRENPFTSETRALASGLAAATAPAGTLLAFATSAGTVASDGRGANGLYTENLVRHMMQPAKDLEKMMKDVSRDVRKETRDKQKPWCVRSLPDATL